MTVSAIFACDANYGIGKNNDLPWERHEGDMLWFRNNTLNHVVVMGSKTWKSIGSKQLSKRINVVITNGDIEGNPDRIESGDFVSILNSLKKIYAGQNIFIIGGANIYGQALPYCDSVFMTKFKETYDCDTYIDSDMLKPFFKMAEKVSDDAEFFIMKRI